MLIKNLLESVNLKHSKEEVKELITVLRRKAVNEKSENILQSINLALNMFEEMGDLKTMVDLYELKIKQLYHSYENLSEVLNILEKMKKISVKINYKDSIVLSLQIEAYIEYFKGNRKKCNQLISKAFELLNSFPNLDQYSVHICKY